MKRNEKKSERTGARNVRVASGTNNFCGCVVNVVVNITECWTKVCYCQQDGACYKTDDKKDDRKRRAKNDVKKFFFFILKFWLMIVSCKIKDNTRANNGPGTRKGGSVGCKKSWEMNDKTVKLREEQNRIEIENTPTPSEFFFFKHTTYNPPSFESVARRARGNTTNSWTAMLLSSETLGWSATREYTKYARQKKQAESVSARPTTLLTASVWIGWSAKKIPAIIPPLWCSLVDPSSKLIATLVKRYVARLWNRTLTTW